MFNISPAAKPSTQFRIFSPFDQDAWRDSTQTAPSPKYKNCFESGSWRWNLFEEKTKPRRLFRPEFIDKNNSQSCTTKGETPNLDGGVIVESYLEKYFSRNKMWNELSKAFQFPIRDFIFDSSEHLKESFDSKLLNTILPLLNPLISTLHKPDYS